jgi:hypothetical protein
MGPLERGSRRARPSDFGQVPSAGAYEHGQRSSAGAWLRMFVGAFFGIAVVVAVGIFGPAIPLYQRGALLGAFTGVLLAPVIALGLFVVMLVPPMSALGAIGDSAWSRLARAIAERRIRHLFVPVVIFLVPPMALGGYGGARLPVIPPLMFVTAGLGAAVLGAAVGLVLGGRS